MHNGGAQDILLLAEQWMHDGIDVVFVTIIASDDHSRFPLGSQTIINERGEKAGIVGFEVDPISLNTVLTMGEPLSCDIQIDAALLQIYIERLG